MESMATGSSGARRSQRWYRCAAQRAVLPTAPWVAMVFSKATKLCAPPVCLAGRAKGRRSLQRPGTAARKTDIPTAAGQARNLGYAWPPR